MTGPRPRHDPRVDGFSLPDGSRLFGLALIAFNLIACGLLLWQGEVEERLGVALIALATLSEIVFGQILIGTWPVGLMLTNVALFAGLWVLTELYDRWWLFVTASVELVILITHLIPLVSSDLAFWTLTTIRLGLWSLISLVLFVGALEAGLARQYRLEEATHGKTPAT